MPKGERVDPSRTDGLSFSALYYLKRGDTWGRVMESQAQALAANEARLRREKEIKDGMYSSQVGGTSRVGG